jgi:hypothetical protein
VPSIYVAALVAVGAVLALWGSISALMARRYRSLWWALLLTLALSPIVNLWVKRPLIVGVARAFDVALENGSAMPLWFWVFLWFVPPLTEEAIKALPLWLPRLRARAQEPGAALWLGFFLGFGFGLSEIGYLAWSIAQAPAYAGYPWWYFTGFIGERLLVAPTHGVLTAITATYLARGRLLAGYGWAVAGHLLLNLGAMLAMRGWLPAVMAGLWIMVPLLVLFVWFTRVYGATVKQEAEPATVYFRRGGP